MLREQKALSGLRPSAEISSSGRTEIYDTINGTKSQVESNSQEPPTLNASSRNNPSLFPFGDPRPIDSSDQPREVSYDFLPSLNFDDLQSSLSPAIDYSSVNTNGSESMISQIPTEDMMNRSGPESRAPASGRAAATRPIRSGSLARRQSTSTRQSSMSSTTSTTSSMNTTSTGGTATRAARQPKYPPISGSGAMKGSRKSGGPGALDTDFVVRATRTRPNMTNNGLLHGQPDGGFSGRSSNGSTTSAAEAGARLASARASKAKSLQPPPRQASGQMHLNAPSTPTDHNRSSSFAGRSPGRQNGRGTATPSSSAKRMSVMPGMLPSSSHATGLGARTISPTDALRAKRMSMVPGVPPMPYTPPTQPEQQSIARASSKSPSLIPRKTSTPSSLRTTPDPNRKSYSSGLSSTSTASFNTARTSTGSLQPRLPGLPQSASTSRLPTPKPNARNVHSSAGNDDDEEVPPVPAIPKAYESPKESPVDPPFFIKQQRKSSLPFDFTSINSSSSNNEASMPPPQETAKQDPAIRSRRDMMSQETGQQSRKNLQPLRLPPLNLLPLSTPTAAKVAALKPEPAPIAGAVTPPPRRPTKTPSTPMTASKASFFSSSRNRVEDQVGEVPPNPRAASSTNHGRVVSSTIRHVSGSHAMPIPVQPSKSARSAVSPFISSSLPKVNNSEYTFMARSTTTSDFMSTDSGEEQKIGKFTGPRVQQTGKESNEMPTQSSPEEPSTPSSTSSLRRKLSMGWKRTTSKNSVSLSHAASERDSEYPPPPPKHSEMPPPKLPASATLNNLITFTNVPSPSPSVKSTTHLETKRRKSSISSLSVFGNHNRSTSDNLGANCSPKKDPTIVPKLAPRTSSTVLSAAHKMLNNKSSSSTIKSQDPWHLDLDKDDMYAEEEMKKLASKRKETESAAKQLDALRRRAVPKERVSPQQALQIAKLNIYEKGEVVDYKDVYFCGTNSAQKHIGDLNTDAANFGYDDERGDYSIVLGDHLSYRYEIVDILGKGSFGQVVRCVDHKTGGLVAIKIIRNKKRFHQQALVEVNILKKLREWDPHNKHSMVSFTQSFYFRGHLCISTELLDMNLYEFIKSNGFRGFSLKLIRRFTKQLLSSLLLLKQHKVIHCDLKPENILLAHPMHSEIKVIDFGSSCFENEKVYTYIQSRFYRSPEVILGMTYGMPIDMWSVGCILAELFTGYPIFPGENEQEQLACIMEVFGPPEKHLIEKSTRKKLFFDSLGKPRLTVSSKGRRRKPSSKTLQQVLKCDDEAFLDFLAKCLRWDPDRRLKPDEAVRHEFLTGMKSSVPRAAATRAGSPLKRFNTITTPSANPSRPLPEPPTTSFKGGVAVRNNTSASPVKVGAAAVPRRQSAATAFNSSTGSNTSGGGQTGGTGKRVSLGGANLGSSANIATNLPRVTQRSVSNGTFANAGATAAMRRG